jgi:hypothetical protein
MPLAIDSVYCPTTAGGTGNPRSTNVIADCRVFPAGGCTLSGPLQFVPGLPVTHCAHEIPDARHKVAINHPINHQ